MNTILKRVISLLLCFVMIAGYVPVNAIAAEIGETVTAETTDVTAEQTEAASEETEAPSESTESLAELSEVTDDSDEEEEEIEKEEKETEKESEKEEKETEKESKKAEKEAEKEAKKEEKESEKETEPSTEPSTEATEPSTEATEPSTEATEPSTEATEPSTEPTSENLLMTLEIEDEADPVAAALEVRAGEEVSSTALEKAQAYIDALTINNTSNDPATVVGNFGTHFTWDNEKRESSKSYLFDWSYYNGVVFEGLEYLYEVTGKTVYKDYVEEYMSSMITADGTWASCTNNTSKQAAGYNSTHGADCYKTASLLMDLYEMTEDKRYLTMAATLYADLDTAAKSYSLPNAGNNYRHTWASDSTPDLWLDGLYMILPFRAEYAAHIGDTEELDLIVDRMQWVSDNMYNEAKDLFYHAADSATSNSGTYWLRSIGWYAAAIVDIMDSMTGDNLRAMQTQLKKLVDGMLLVQNSNNGMWLNNMAAAQSSTNPYETSGTALVCYAVMKAVNEGWLDDDYADMAVLAFNGICDEKLSGTTLTDICFKGSPGDSNSTFYDNEGKGVGPFIMLYAEILEYTGVKPEQPEEPEQPTEPSEPTEPADQEITVEGTTEGETPVTMTVSGVSAAVTAAVLTEEDKTLLDAHEGIESYVAIDVTGTLAEGEQATFTVAIPEGWDADRVVGISVEEGKVKEILGTHENGYFTFTVEHFSAKGVGLTAKAAETTGKSGTGNLLGGTRYVLDTDGVDAGATYLIVSANSGNASAFRNNNGSSSAQSVTITNGAISSGFNNESTSTWTFTASGNAWYISNGNQRIRLSNSDILNESGQTLTVSNQGDGAYRISASSYYLRYYNYSWQRRSYQGNVYLFKQETSEGGEVTFTINPASATIQPNDTVALTGTVTVDGETVNLSNCTVTWATGDDDVATVSDGTVTGVADGTANITATLSAVNGTALQENITLTIPVTVQSRKIVSIALSEDVGNVVNNKPESTVIVDGNGDAIQVIITYDSGDPEYTDLTLGMLSGNFDIKTPGTYRDLTATWMNQTATGFTLNVTMNPGNNFPEYPDPGAVDVNKVTGDVSQFQNTGVAEVQLSTSGIPIKTGVNVLLIMDISNSMSWDDSDYDYDDQTVVAGTNQRLNISRDSAKDFANELFKDYADGTPTSNTLTLLAFAGIDGDYNTHSTASANDDVYQLGTLCMDNYDAVESALDQMVKATTGGTNYDYAFQQAYSLAEQIHEKNENPVYIVFMTDGVPTHYNGVYYKSRSNTDLTACMQYVDPTTGATSSYTSNGYDRAGNDIDDTATKRITVYYNNGSTAEKNVTYNKGWSDYVTGNKNGWAEKVKSLDYLAKVYSIGFGMKNGSVTQGATSSMPTLNNVNGGQYYIPSDVTKTTLQHIASTDADYYEADSTEELTELYQSLAGQIREAAYNAYFVDQMGGSFDLQLGSYVTKFAGTEKEENVALNTAPAITVSTYPIYKQSEVNGTTVTQDMVGQRKNVSPTVVETVVFNADGNAAYSDKLGGYTETTKTVTDSNNKQVTVKDHTGTQNILIDGVICAKNFWYNTTKETKNITLADGSTYALPAETFYWNIGTINELEFVLSYYVYLSGASEGTAKKGTYATNNYATLYYENWLGNNVEQDVQSPALAWESAAVYYGFYLVDKTTGLPVVNQATGQTGSFTDAIKITQKIFHEEVLLNDVDSVKSTISVNSTLVPDEYEVYDTGAQYTIYIDSGETISGWKIVNTKYGQYKDPTTGEDVPTGTTYVTDYRGTESTNVEDSDTFVGDERTGLDFTATTVWFAVCWEPQALPDTVVIDYGQPVNISVLNNDMFGNYGQLTGVGALEDMPEAAYTSDSIFGTNLTAEYGTVTIKGEKVCYTPSTMEMPTYDKFAYEASYTKPEVGAQYYYNTVTVIPATTIYYEDSFLKLEVGNSAGWSGVEKSDATQGEDRPGQYSLPAVDANNVYGYDGAYSNCSTYSLDSAAKVHLENGQYATAEFTFYGTGFDVISLTSNETGVLAVQVSAGSTFDAEKLERDTLVNTYYGMNADGTVSPNTPAALYQVPVMKIENLPYGQYTARITATYVGFFDKTDAAGYDLYLDAIRIYDPAGTQYGESDDADGVTGNLIDGVIQDAYIDDNEGWPVYVELRNHIISAADVKVTTGDDGNPKVTSVSSENATVGAMFIDCANDNTSISDYVSYGPNNELYLAANQAVAFSLGMDTTAWENVADVQIGLKVANGNSVNYKVYDATTTEEADITATMLNTATEMYYSIKGHAAGSTVIKNVSGGILSITNIKITYKSDPNGTAVTMAMPEEDAGMVLLSLRAPRVSEPEVPETSEPEESIPETSAPEESVPETTVPEETVPETTVPEETEDQREQVEQAVKEVVKTVVKSVKNVLQNLFSKWFR